MSGRGNICPWLCRKCLWDIFTYTRGQLDVSSGHHQWRMEHHDTTGSQPELSSPAAVFWQHTAAIVAHQGHPPRSCKSICFSWWCVHHLPSIRVAYFPREPYCTALVCIWMTVFIEGLRWGFRLRRGMLAWPALRPLAEVQMLITSSYDTDTRRGWYDFAAQRNGWIRHDLLRQKVACWSLLLIINKHLFDPEPVFVISKSISTNPNNFIIMINHRWYSNIFEPMVYSNLYVQVLMFSKLLFTSAHRGLPYWTPALETARRSSLAELWLEIPETKARRKVDWLRGRLSTASMLTSGGQSIIIQHSC